MDAVLERTIKLFVEKTCALLPVRMIVLYGSYAKGSERTDSDIDIAVVVDELREDWLTTSKKLFLLASEIDMAIEPNLIVAKNNNSGFLESILQYGIILYQATKAA